MNFNIPTPLEQYTFKNIPFFLKRDDLISQDFSGNKARKIEHYKGNLPENIDTIVSFGSIQSNAMYSLAKFASIKGLHFRYYANHIPQILMDNPHGNMLLALKEGMELCEGYEGLENIASNELLIQEGIATKEAFIGIEQLAQEIIEQLPKKSFEIFLPSGTGTTALYLSKALQKMGADYLKVFTTPCVGDSAYLIKQWNRLEKESRFYPRIIETQKKYHFGKLYAEFYQIWLELRQETNVEFELLYDPNAWIAILENRDIFSNLLYVHQGGILGNVSMLERYKYKFGVKR